MINEWVTTTAVKVLYAEFSSKNYLKFTWYV